MELGKQLETDAIIPASHARVLDQSGYGGDKEQLDYALNVKLELSAVAKRLHASSERKTGVKNCSKFVCWFCFFLPEELER